MHRRYNPEGVTAYNIVGLIGTILTMTMVLMTGLAMTRERERGTFENLLSTPALPIEVMTGKIVPYILIGLIQVTLIIIAALLLFEVPMRAIPCCCISSCCCFAPRPPSASPFPPSRATNCRRCRDVLLLPVSRPILALGFPCSRSAAWPEWAQWIVSVLPLTPFLQLVRGIMLKGNGFMDLWPQMWPIVVFMLAVIGVGLRFYKRTLD